MNEEIVKFKEFIGKEKFDKFLRQLEIPSETKLKFWQTKIIEEFESQSNIKFPQDFAQLKNKFGIKENTFISNKKEKKKNTRNIEKMVSNLSREVVLLEQKRKLLFNKFTTMRNGRFYDTKDAKWPTNKKGAPLSPLLQINFKEFPLEHPIKKQFAGLTIYVDDWVDCDVYSCETDTIEVRELPLNEKLTPLKIPPEAKKLLSKKVEFVISKEYPDTMDYWLNDPIENHTNKESFYESVDDDHLEEMGKKYKIYDQSKIFGWPINRQWGCHFLTGEEYFLIQITYSDFDLTFGDNSVLFISKEKSDSKWLIHWETF